MHHYLINQRLYISEKEMPEAEKYMSAPIASEWPLPPGRVFYSKDYELAVESWKSQSRSYPLFDPSQANHFLHLMKEGEAFKLPDGVAQIRNASGPLGIREYAFLKESGGGKAEVTVKEIHDAAVEYSERAEKPGIRVDGGDYSICSFIAGAEFVLKQLNRK